MLNRCHVVRDLYRCNPSGCRSEIHEESPCYKCIMKWDFSSIYIYVYTWWGVTKKLLLFFNTHRVNWTQHAWITDWLLCSYLYSDVRSSRLADCSTHSFPSLRRGTQPVRLPGLPIGTRLDRLDAYPVNQSMPHMRSGLPGCSVPLSIEVIAGDLVIYRLTESTQWGTLLTLYVKTTGNQLLIIWFCVVHCTAQPAGQPDYSNRQSTVNNLILRTPLHRAASVYIYIANWT
jgi:hypothetical protein